MVRLRILQCTKLIKILKCTRLKDSLKILKYKAYFLFIWFNPSNTEIAYLLREYIPV